MNPERFSKGWNGERVRGVLEHSENQSEDEAAYEDPTQALMEIPLDLVADVRGLIARNTSTGS